MALKLSDDILNIAVAFNANKFHLVAHDWGAGIGWNIVYQNPKMNNLRLSIESDYNFRQNEFPDNNFEVFVPETQTREVVDVSTPPDAYHLLNFNSSININLNQKSILTVGIAITNILNAGSEDWTLRAVMYPYTGSSGVVLPNGNVCHDSSPIFKEQAKSILCTGYPFSYSHLAFDVELDSLSYSWAEPLDVASSYDYTNPSSQAIPYIGGYTVTSPIPGNPTLDSENGEISFFSTGAPERHPQPSTTCSLASTV